MLIRLDDASAPECWVVWMDACCAKFRSSAEAETFMKRLEDRINAPHPLPISINRQALELEVSPKLQRYSPNHQLSSEGRLSLLQIDSGTR